VSPGLRSFDPPRDVLQQLVARRVAEAVVDVLEAVQVEEENRETEVGLTAAGGELPRSAGR
jgi:hypothetical protein